MKLTLLYVTPLLLFACSTAPIILPESQTVPAVKVDTVYVYDAGSYGTSYGGECDTAAILALLCRGEVHGEEYGLNWKVLWEMESQRADSLSKVKTRVKARIVRDSIRVPLPPELLAERERLRTENAALKAEVSTLKENQHTFWSDAKLVLYGVIIGVVLAIVGFGAIKSGLIKLPFLG